MCFHIAYLAKNLKAFYVQWHKTRKCSKFERLKPAFYLLHMFVPHYWLEILIFHHINTPGDTVHPVYQIMTTLKQTFPQLPAMLVTHCCFTVSSTCIYVHVAPVDGLVQGVRANRATVPWRTKLTSMSHHGVANHLAVPGLWERANSSHCVSWYSWRWLSWQQECLLDLKRLLWKNRKALEKVLSGNQKEFLVIWCS